MNSTSLFIEIA